MFYCAYIFKFKHILTDLNHGSVLRESQASGHHRVRTTGDDFYIVINACKMLVLFSYTNGTETPYNLKTLS